MTAIGTYPATADSPPGAYTETASSPALQFSAATAPRARAPIVPQTSSLPGEAPDSVAGDAGSAADGALGGTADSLQIPAGSHGFRNAAPEAVFGTLSTAAPAPQPDLSAAPSLTSNAVFQSFVLLLAATYAVLLYRHLGDIRILLGRVLRDRATSDRLTEEPGGSGLPHFLNVTAAIGILFIGVITIRYGDSLIPRNVVELLPRSAVLLLSLAASLAFAGVALYQMATLRIAASVTLSQPFMGQLSMLKRTYFALVVITVSPPLLLYALCPPGTGEGWFYVIAIELLLTAVLYLRETLNLFISKKISILHWFLYLCTVEIFPLSLVWLLAGR